MKPIPGNGIGRTRLKLVKVLQRDLNLKCDPADLDVNRQRTDKNDQARWEGFAKEEGRPGRTFIHSYSTMTECAKSGVVWIDQHEICAK